MGQSLQAMLLLNGARADVPGLSGSLREPGAAAQLILPLTSPYKTRDGDIARFIDKND
jgi:hypothetical protein